MMVHTGEKPHKCPYCEHRSTFKSNITKHIARIHGAEQLATATSSSSSYASNSDPFSSLPCLSTIHQSIIANSNSSNNASNVGNSSLYNNLWSLGSQNLGLLDGGSSTCVLPSSMFQEQQ